MTTVTSPTGKYGLYDMRDSCWLGDANGPVRYDDRAICLIAAAVASEQLGRVIAIRRYYCEEPVLVDEVETRMGPIEAIRNIERRAKC